MMHSKQWRVDIYEHDDERRTRAEARLTTSEKTHLIGTGVARRNPTDSEVPEIGDELAAARALSDLAHALLDAAANDIQSISSKPAHLST